jgi:AraC-like DNA-binding protein
MLANCAPATNPRKGVYRRHVTSDRMKECLGSIGWSLAELGRRLHASERNLRRMFNGSAPIPAAIADWLEAMVTHMRAAPPPPERRND